jgi:tetratricopeptide (TPR) repeat protein
MERKDGIEQIQWEEIAMRSTDEILSLEEKKELADDLLLKGEMSLLIGDLEGLDLFTKAAELDPANATLYYRQGLSLFEYGCKEGREKALLLAGKKFKKATTLDPRCFLAWQAWGSTLFFLGKTFDEHHFFIEAKAKYDEALLLAEDRPSEEFSELYWNIAITWFELGEQSGEALDLQLAIEAFEKASNIDQYLPEEFWIDFGRANFALAYLVNDIRLFIKAVNCFKSAISLCFSSFSGWFHLAKALKSLYELTHDEDHFSQANECFSAAAQIRPQESELWLEWARFLKESGKRNQDTKRLRSSIEKCRKMLSLEPRHAVVIAIWSEALATLGELTDRLDLIYDAQNKITEAVSIARDIPEVWLSYGTTQCAFARYFNDVEYYHQAVEKFQCGLSIDRTSHGLWYALAKTYTAIGEINIEKEDFSHALRFYQKALAIRYCSYCAYDLALTLLKFGELLQSQKVLEQAVCHFEKVLTSQRNAIYVHADWLYNYGHSLDLLGDFFEEEMHYIKAIEVFSHVLMVDPEFPHIHHRLALTYFHLAELKDDIEMFYRSLHHFRLAAKHDEENDQVILDWGILLIDIANRISDPEEIDQLHKEAEHKLSQSAKLGNLHAYYHLGCLYSLLGQNEKAMRFLLKADHFASLPPKDEILHDDWLEGLKNSSDFHDLISRLEQRSHSSDLP